MIEITLRQSFSNLLFYGQNGRLVEIQVGEDTCGIVILSASGKPTPHKYPLTCLEFKIVQGCTCPELLGKHFEAEVDPYSQKGIMIEKINEKSQVKA